ncbi:MAG: 23S rRNA (guanosine(2251)-2'-O)-methyltransferase RlmB [Clostridia bacterium]|nr:23S rRNA (guanosine(2251)-2'-O)-methyltransferase RlmB [Clostridia bacterium]MBN2882681.1 23S rRNA (guanosine(2251)-2'-O)-methyltransferase RlmB [Clostridia bacterium]
MNEETNIIAGRNPVFEAIKARTEISSIMVAKGSTEGTIKAIISTARKKKIPVKEVSPVKLDGLVPQGNHQGVVAIISPIKYQSLNDIFKIAEEKGEDPLIVILDGIEDVHNLGAIARTAEACGAHGIVIPMHRAASVTTTSVKASAGALMHIPVCRVTNITVAMDEMKKKGLWIAGADMEGAQPYYKSNLKGPFAIVIGGEGQGIRRLVLEKCDFTVNIPMKGRMSSLNASNAAAVILFEVLRQRENQ